MPEMLSFVPWLLAALCGLACLLALLPLLRGPGDAERVIALDILLAAALALCIVAALLSGRTVYLDVALGLALVGFVATLGWARLIADGTR